MSIVHVHDAILCRWSYADFLSFECFTDFVCFALIGDLTGVANLSYRIDR